MTTQTKRPRYVLLAANAAHDADTLYRRLWALDIPHGEFTTARRTGRNLITQIRAACERATDAAAQDANNPNTQDRATAARETLARAEKTYNNLFSLGDTAPMFDTFSDADPGL